MGEVGLEPTRRNRHGLLRPACLPISALALMSAKCSTIAKELRIYGKSGATDMKKFVYATTTDNPIYGMGLLGALIYFISTAPSFWMGLLGVLKALFWPAMLAYEALKFLNA